MKRTFVAVALAVIFVLALAAPAFAANLTHTATYEMDGVINFKKQAGHACNTGGVLKQTIAGSGKMDKIMDIAMVAGKLTVADTNDWVAGATPLTVTSVWELCTPPKYTIEGKDKTDYEGYDIPVHYSAMYNEYNIPAVAHIDGDEMEVLGTTVANLAADQGWDALTGQIWAVQVKADPGFSGNLHQKGEAAYGPYWTNPNDDTPFAYDASWKYDMVDYSDHWRFELDKDGILGRSVGADYVGDYFNMQQMARTSQGTLKRYIDVSSPWSHAYLMQDMTIVGKSEVSEYFTMPNQSAGSDITPDWWNLF